MLRYSLITSCAHLNGTAAFETCRNLYFVCGFYLLHYQVVCYDKSYGLPSVPPLTIINDNHLIASVHKVLELCPYVTMLHMI